MPGPTALGVVGTPADEPEDYSVLSKAIRPSRGRSRTLSFSRNSRSSGREFAAAEVTCRAKREISALRRDRDRRRQQALPPGSTCPGDKTFGSRSRTRPRPARPDGRTTTQRRSNGSQVDVAGCDAEIERLRQHENDHLRAQAGRFATRLRREARGPIGPSSSETTAPEPASHLVFVQLGRRLRARRDRRSRRRRCAP